jgi:hypothetical protein
MAVKPTDNHVQCKLRRVNGVITTSWLPQKYAVVGKFLKLKNDEGEWENGWEVTATFAIKSTTEVLARGQDYKHQRKASDI